MADFNWFSSFMRVVARFLRAYPLLQISTAAALWAPVSSGLQYGLSLLGWSAAVDSATKGLGVPISGAGVSGVMAFVLIGIVQHFKRQAFRRRYAKATETRQKNLEVKEQRLAKAEALAAESERNKLVAAFEAMTPEMKSVLRLAVEARRSEVNVGGRGVASTVAARQLEDLGYVRFDHDYRDGMHSATLSPSVFKFLLANPELVGSKAGAFFHRDKLKLP